jgi:hypothetical protein
MRLLPLVIATALVACSHQGESQTADFADGTKTILVGQPWPQAQRVARRAGYQLHDLSQLAMVPTPDGYYLDMPGRRGLLIFRDPLRDVVMSMAWVENWDGPKAHRVLHDVASFDVPPTDSDSTASPVESQ